MMVFKRKQVVFIALVIMVAVAGYLNWSYQEEMKSVPTMADEFQKELEKNLGEAHSVDNEVSDEDMSAQAMVEFSSAHPYFIEARLEKQIARSQAIEVLQNIVDNQNATEKAKMDAQKQIMTLANHIDVESTIENLIKARGFKEAVAFINNDKINIVVQTPGLEQAQVAQIMDVVMNQTNASADQIKIMEIN